jgi:hypothetical protein
VDWVYTYVVWVRSGNVQPVRPVDKTHGLSAVLEKVIVGSLVDSLDFIATEDERVNRPVGVLDIIDLGGHRGHNAKVVTCSLESPPEVGPCVNRLQAAVGQDDIG